MAMALTFRTAVVGATPSAKLLQAKKNTTRVSAAAKVRTKNLEKKNVFSGGVIFIIINNSTGRGLFGALG